VSICGALVRRWIRYKENPVKYLSFIRSSEAFRNSTPPAALQEAMGKLIEKNKKEGVLVATGGLAPSKDGLRVRSSGGKLSVTDGPFTESKEIIGGWAILEAATPEIARRIAVEFMELHTKYWPEFEGESEVRPIDFSVGL
jgi:hypothetical protein